MYSIIDNSAKKSGVLRQGSQFNLLLINTLKLVSISVL